MGFWRDLGSLLSGKEDINNADNLTEEQEAELKAIQAVEEEVRKEVPSRTKILQAKARENKTKVKETKQINVVDKEEKVVSSNVSRTSIARETAKRNRNKTKNKDEAEIEM
mgnify:CR=1 FL=1